MSNGFLEMWIPPSQQRDLRWRLLFLSLNVQMKFRPLGMVEIILKKMFRGDKKA